MFCKTQTYIYLGPDKVRLIKIQYDAIVQYILYL